MFTLYRVIHVHTLQGYSCSHSTGLFMFTLYRIIHIHTLQGYSIRFFITSNTVLRVYGVLLLNNWGTVAEPSHFEHGPLSADFL